MNRQSLPIIIVIFIPIILLFLLLSYNYGFDIISLLKKIDIIYYIIVFPIILGFIVIIVKWLRPD